MEVYDQARYRELAGWLDMVQEKKLNAVLVAIPGMGTSYLLKKYAARSSGGVRYVAGDGERLGSFTMLDIDFCQGMGVLGVVDRYFRQAGTEEKMLFVVNDPSMLDRPEYQKSYFVSHIYETRVAKVLDVEDVAKVVEEFQVRATREEVEEIFDLSGGISQLVKYLATHWERGVTVADWLKQEDLARMARLIGEVVARSKREWLEQMRVTVKGKIQSSLLREVVGGLGFAIDLKVGKDLAVCEDGFVGEKIARVERDILEVMLRNEGYISKEEVAEVKWGSKSFSDFSDQAINKAMRRLDGKLKRYQIQTIWKTGYRLERR